MLDSSAQSASKRQACRSPPGQYSSWPELNSELVVSIAASVSLRDYACLRRVCTAWRSALAPATYPRLLSLSLAQDDDDRHTASIVSLPKQRPFHLHTMYSTLDDGDDRDGTVLHSSVRVVGSGNARFALAVDQKHRDPCPGGGGNPFPNGWRRRIVLADARTGEEVMLASPTGGFQEECVRKVVFAPNPNDDWTVVAMYNNEKVAYIDAKMDKEWTTVDVLAGNTGYLLDMAFDPAAGDKVYILDSHAGLHVLRVPRAGHNSLERAVVERLATLVLSLNPTAAYAPPYGVASPLMVAKHIFFCHGSLYQVWRNTSANVNFWSRWCFTMSKGEIFILRYDPGRWPCWDAVRDLGGCSVFVSKISSPRVVRAGALPGVRANSVYWMDEMGVPMRCDMATGTSEPCVLPYANGACKGDCWYFNGDGPASMVRISDLRNYS